MLALQKAEKERGGGEMTGGGAERNSKKPPASMRSHVWEQVGFRVKSNEGSRRVVVERFMNAGLVPRERSSNTSISGGKSVILYPVSFSR